MAFTAVMYVWYEMAIIAVEFKLVEMVELVEMAGWVRMVGLV